MKFVELQNDIWTLAVAALKAELDRSMSSPPGLRIHS